MANFALYKRAPEWGLPSLCPSCVEVEAYLRLVGAEFAVEECVGEQKSPTGHLPALEDEKDLPSSPAGASEAKVARGIISWLKEKGYDLDSHLSSSGKADLLAFTALVETSLVQATTYASWVEYTSYNTHMRQAWGSGLPWPVSYIVPYRRHKAAAAAFASAGSTPEEVIQRASAAYSALSDRLGSCKFLLGPNPCSLDALVFAHLRYHMLAPVAPTALQAELGRHPRLKAYTDMVASEFFGAPAAPPPEDWRGASGGAGAGGEGAAGAGGAQGERARVQVARQKKRARLWMMMAGAVVIGYLILGDSGIFHIEFDDDDDEDMDE